MKPKVKACALIVLALSLVFCSLAIADETDLVWSTFLGGSYYDYGTGIAVDDSGCAYVTGDTFEGGDFPTTSGAFDTTFNSNWDVFVAKLNPMGSDLVYATFLGGLGADQSYGIAIDDSGNSYVTGVTYGGVPTTPGAFDTTANGAEDVFVTKLNTTGSALIYSTFLGGISYDRAYGIVVDNANNAYITGQSYGEGFPTTSGVFDSIYNGGNGDAFVVKLNIVGSALDYATFLGGSNSEAGVDIAVDNLHNAYIGGHTSSSNFPVTVGAFSTTYNGNGDAFVARLNAAGNALNYSTFMGGSYNDGASGIAADEFGNAFVTGSTEGWGFPTTAGAFDITHNGGADIFLVKVKSTGSELDYATFLGGTSWDEGYDVAVDSSGDAYVAGYTYSADFPATDWAFDMTHNGFEDALMVKLNATGGALDYATFLGGSSDDGARSIAVGEAGDVFVTGRTDGCGFPTTACAFDTGYNGNSDAFMAKFDLSGYPVPVVLARFEVTGDQGFIAINWVTASEIDCHKWEILRGKLEDGEYTKIGELPGHGSTEMAHTYQWVDRQVHPGVTYFYKLKQMDFDGTSWWSHIVSATASSSVPQSYALSQNYPNPFNPSTEISYAIPEDIHVTMKVYNILGAEVATLADDHKQAGFYTVRWDAENLASGVYFCRLQADDFEKTIKMVFLK